MCCQENSWSSRARWKTLPVPSPLWGLKKRALQIMSDHVRSFKEGWVQMLQGLWDNCCHFIITSSILIHSDPWACRSFVFCGPGLALRRCAIFLDPLSFSKWLEHRETMAPTSHRRRMMAGNRRSLGPKWPKILYPKMAAIPRCHKGESMIKAGHIYDYIGIMYIYIIHILQYASICIILT